MIGRSRSTQVVPKSLVTQMLLPACVVMLTEATEAPKSVTSMIGTFLPANTPPKSTAY